MRDELLRGAHFTASGLRIGVTKKQIAREFDRVANLAAQKRVHRNVELLSDDVQACELDRRVQLRAIVVKARRRIADREAHGFQPEDVVAAEVRFERGKRARRVLAAAAHFAETHVAVAGFDLDDRAHEAAPMRAVAVEQRRFERHRYRRRADRGDRRGHREGKEMPGENAGFYGEFYAEPPLPCRCRATIRNRWPIPDCPPRERSTGHTT